MTLTLSNNDANSSWYSYYTYVPPSTLSNGTTYINRGGQWVPAVGGGTQMMTSEKVQFLLQRLGFVAREQSRLVCYRYQDDAEYSITLNRPEDIAVWRDEDVRLVMEHVHTIITNYERKHGAGGTRVAASVHPATTELDAEEW